MERGTPSRGLSDPHLEMSRQSIIAGVLLLIVGCTSVVRADEAALRKELEQIMAAQLAAYKKKDVKAYLKYIAPDYSITLTNGNVLTRTRPELEDYFLTDMQETVSIGFVLRDIKKVTERGKLVIVLVAQTSSRVLREGDSQHKWDIELIQRERWIKTDEGLKVSSLEILEVVYMIEDGKLIESTRAKKPKRTIPHRRRRHAV